MYKTHTIAETRKVHDFEQVSIKGNTCSAQVFITQGAQETLTIEAPPEYLPRLLSEVKDGRLTIRLAGSWLQELEDALTTCLNRPHIVYRLQVRQLARLEVQCARVVHLTRLDTPHLHVKLDGTGDFNADWLSAKTLEAQHSGSGTMRASGQVEDQTVVLNGVGCFLAPGLASQRARLRISGTGFARIRVSQALDVTMRGVGILEYIGRPSVSQQISGPGRVYPIESVSEIAA